ncbi:MAG: hypothetical protein ACP5NX_02200 [Candidatus Bilamarchaeaceae archaeon]
MVEFALKVAYKYSFDFRMLEPVVESIPIWDSKDTLSSQMPISERIDRNVSETAMAYATVGSSQKSDHELTRDSDGSDEVDSYTLTYFNPETKKTEVVAGKVDIAIKDYTTKAVEQSLGAKNTLPIFKLVASPIALTVVDPDRLKQILDEREYGTPPESGAGAVVSVEKAKAMAGMIRVEQKADEAKAGQAAAVQRKRAESARKSEIVALRPELAVPKESIIIAEERKERVEGRIDEEVAAFEEALSMLDRGEDLDTALAKLPALSRARLQILARKKKMSRKVMHSILETDLKFLRATKEKLKGMSIRELVSLSGVLKGILGKKGKK